MTRAASAALILLLFATPAALEARKPAAPQSPQTSAEDPDLAALRADLTRARSLVAQMERNLGFVDNGLTPLKHQFQLEIDMWNLLINDMQRRLNAAERRSAPAAKPAAP